MLNNKKISVSELNKYIANVINDDFILKNVCVDGEVSNFKISCGNIYFNLKDKNSYISCIIFKSVYDKLNINIIEGMHLTVYGRVSVYEPFGKYSIIISDAKKEGIGELYEKFEKLKIELEEKGMFDPMYKKDIPKYAMSIGIVTSNTGAAVEDMKKIILSKNPHINIVVYPCIVQGDKAKQSIIRGIEVLDALGLDVMIVGRGGGSFEDLNCFNDVDIAYAVFNAVTPIISAVGHEIDWTIIDFVSDKRAATPTDAANIASWSYEDLQIELDNKIDYINQIICNKLNDIEYKLEYYSDKLKANSPKAKIENCKLKLENNKKYLEMTFQNILLNIKNDLKNKIDLLKKMSPLEKISAGFAYVEDENNKKIISIKELQPGNTILTTLKDGVIESSVTCIKEKILL